MTLALDFTTEAAAHARMLADKILNGDPAEVVEKLAYLRGRIAGIHERLSATVPDGAVLDPELNSALQLTAHFAGVAADHLAAGKPLHTEPLPPIDLPNVRVVTDDDLDELGKRSWRRGFNAGALVGA